MLDQKYLYAMELHETLTVTHFEMKKGRTVVEVLRVPGGWIYSHLVTSSDHHSAVFNTTFVPYSNEYWKNPNPSDAHP